MSPEAKPVQKSEAKAAQKPEAKAVQKKLSRERLRVVLPEVWQLIRARRGLLALGFLLMVINRVSGLVLPYTSRFLIDDVMIKHQVQMLKPLVLAVLAATAIQGSTSFALTQLLSKAAQRLIAELRRKVQEHIGRLPVSFYDSNKSGTLVARIMSDVEGVRNLLGTGLVDFAGGLLTSAIAFVVLLRISSTMTLLTFGFLLCFAVALNKAFGTIRPIFRERSKINAEVTGRLTESLGGVRVIKGYHAEEREHSVFSAGVQRLLNNVMRTLTATSVMSLSSSLLLGVVGAVIMYVGARQTLAGTLTIGKFFTYTLFLGFLIAPIIQIVNIGTQITEALAGLERTHEILSERPEDTDPKRSVTLPVITGNVAFDQLQGRWRQESATRARELLHPRGEMRRLADSGVVHVEIVPYGADDDLTRVEADADLHVDAVSAASFLGVSLDRLLHPQGRVARADRVILVGNGGPEQRHDAVAHHLVHRPLVAVDGLHHEFKHRIKDLAGLFGIAVGEEFHRALEVGEEHGHLLALAFQGTLGGEDLLGEVLGGVGPGRGEARLWSSPGYGMCTLRAELRYG